MPTSSVDATTSPSPSSIESDAKAESDAFWDRSAVYSPLAIDYDVSTLEQAVSTAHLIIVGRVDEVYIAELWRGGPRTREPFAYLRVEIDHVIKGKPVSRRPGFVEVQYYLFGQHAVDREFMALPPPGHRILLFLMHEATVREATGAPPRSYSDVAPFAYFNLLGAASVLRDIDGREQMILPEVYAANFGEETFPLAYEGVPFDDLVAEVERAVDS